jgi:hypothetical protein
VLLRQDLKKKNTTSPSEFLEKIIILHEKLDEITGFDDTPDAQ